jgi:Mg-chelatase subunit ChlI
LIINELNALTLNAQIALNPLLDKQECVIITQNNNEAVKIGRNSHLLVLATMNPDVMGVNELQDSIRDRSNIVIYMDYPSIEKETQLINKLTGYSLATARQFVDVINECRLLKTRDHQITKAPSTRGILDWINYSSTLGTEVAFQLNIVNKYGSSEEERKALSIIGQGKGISNFKIEKEIIENHNIEHDEKNVLLDRVFDLYSAGKKVSEISVIVGKSERTLSINLEKLGHEFQDSPVGVDSENALIKRNC